MCSQSRLHIMHAFKYVAKTLDIPFSLPIFYSLSPPPPFTLPIYMYLFLYSYRGEIDKNLIGIQ